MTGLGVEVFVRRGRLMLRILAPLPALYRGLPLMPDSTDPYAFWLDLSRFDIGTARVVFSRDTGSRVTAVHFDLLPMSADKRPELANPRRWAEIAVVVATLATIGRASRHRSPIICSTSPGRSSRRVGSPNPDRVS